MKYKIIEKRLPDGSFAYSIKKPIFWGLFYVDYLEPVLNIYRSYHCNQRNPCIKMEHFLYSTQSEATNIIRAYKEFREAKVKSKLGARIEKCHNGFSLLLFQLTKISMVLLIPVIQKETTIIL